MSFQTRYSRFQTRYSSFQTRYSSFKTRYSSFQTRYSSFQTRYSSFQTRYSSFQTRYSSFQTRYSSFKTRYSSFQTGEVELVRIRWTTKFWHASIEFGELVIGLVLCGIHPHESWVFIQQTANKSAIVSLIKSVYSSSDIVFVLKAIILWIWIKF